MILRFAIEEGDGWRVMKTLKDPLIGEYTVILDKGLPEDTEQGIYTGAAVLVMHTGRSIHGGPLERMWEVRKTENGDIEWVRDTKDFLQDMQRTNVVPRPSIPEEISLYAEELVRTMGWRGGDPRLEQ